jgi:hypothetical protein
MEETWMDTTVAHFMVLSKTLSAETEHNHEK